MTPKPPWAQEEAGLDSKTNFHNIVNRNNGIQPLKCKLTKHTKSSYASLEGFCCCFFLFCQKHTKQWISTRKTQENSPGCPGESLREPHKSISTTFSSCIINNAGAELIHFTEPEPRVQAPLVEIHHSAAWLCSRHRWGRSIKPQPAGCPGWHSNSFHEHCVFQ